MSKFIIKPGVNLVAMLKDKGYSTYYMGKHPAETFGNAALKKFRDGGLPSWGELAKLITLLCVSPIDLIAIQTDKGAIYDLTGKIRLDTPAPSDHEPSVQHGHPGDVGQYDDPDHPEEPDDW